MYNFHVVIIWIILVTFHYAPPVVEMEMEKDGDGGEGHGNQFQYSCLENPMGRGTWWATVHGGAEELDTTEWLNNMHHQYHYHCKNQSLFWSLYLSDESLKRFMHLIIK